MMNVDVKKLEKLTSKVTCTISLFFAEGLQAFGIGIGTFGMFLTLTHSNVTDKLEQRQRYFYFHISVNIIHRHH